MKSRVKGVLSLASLATGVAVFFATPASAQATRTWVSGVGDDVNPCSRTAPCKTFAGAISKTAAGGEIDCLDPAGFGTVTITKSITIDCTGTLGSILNSGGINGVVINDSATGSPGTIEVKLRGISIDGAGTTPGLNGVRFVTGRSLLLEDVFIVNQKSGAGVSLQPNTSARISFKNVTIADGATGVLVQPIGNAGNAAVSLEKVSVQNNSTVGLRIDTTGNTSITGTGVVVNDSTFTGNPTGILVVETFSNSNADATVYSSVVSNNGIGIGTAGSGTATVRVGRTVIMGNGTGTQPAGSGSVRTYGNNMVDGNTTPGIFSGAVLPET